MDFNVYNPAENAIKSVGMLSEQLKGMLDGQQALSILPADTRFAIVANMIERNTGQSFNEVAYTVGEGVETGIGAGLEGKFVGYIAVSQQRLRIIREGQTIFDEVASAVVVSTFNMLVTIGNTSKTYLLEDVNQINGVNVRFQSKIGGLSGTAPLLEQLKTIGVPQDKIATSKASTVVLVALLLIVVIGLSAYLVIAAHKAK